MLHKYSESTYLDLSDDFFLAQRTEASNRPRFVLPCLVEDSSVPPSVFEGHFSSSVRIHIWILWQLNNSMINFEIEAFDVFTNIFVVVFVLTNYYSKWGLKYFDEFLNNLSKKTRNDLFWWFHENLWFFIFLFFFFNAVTAYQL